MARTSRRDRVKAAEEVSLSTGLATSDIPRLATAAYVRLSVEEEQGESISSQLELLREYISKSDDLELAEVYVDNGYTGTNFDRPDFSRMMSDIQCGIIQCIVVKDLSRFGRNLLETGYYIETLLPRLNARLIAVNDNFDSNRPEDQASISVPVKNMVNELYAKDISRKICASNEARRKSGNFTIGHSVYGYTVDRKNNRYVVNPETAPVIQLIFHWLAAGTSFAVIASRLNSLGIVTPYEYKCLNENWTNTAGDHDWTARSINTLVMKDIYTGDRCIGTRQSAAYKGQSETWMPREAWTIYENDHEPLVTREDFDKVQNRFIARRNRRHEVSEHLRVINPNVEPLFAGRVYCCKCGRGLDYRLPRNEDGVFKRESIDYVCKGKNYSGGKVICSTRVREDQLMITVLDSIKLIISVTLEQEKLLKKLKRFADDRNPVNKLRGRVDNLVRNKEMYSEKLSRLYEDLSFGVIDQDVYAGLREKYQSERACLEIKISAAKEELADAEKGIRDFEEFAGEISQLPEDLSLTPALLDQFVEKIVADEDDRIEIIFKCDDVLKQVAAMTEGGKL